MCFKLGEVQQVGATMYDEEDEVQVRSVGKLNHRKKYKNRFPALHAAYLILVHVLFFVVFVVERCSCRVWCISSDNRMLMMVEVEYELTGCLCARQYSRRAT